MPTYRLVHGHTAILHAQPRADLGADSSKTRKHVMPENVLSENYVPISRVKLVLYCLRPAQSMNGRNVLDFRPTL